MLKNMNKHGNLTYSENFYLSQQGLILQYAEYEIGLYVVGLPRLTVPSDQFTNSTEKQYLPVPEPVATSEAATLE